MSSRVEFYRLTPGTQDPEYRFDYKGYKYWLHKLGGSDKLWCVKYLDRSGQWVIATVRSSLDRAVGDAMADHDLIERHLDGQ